MARPGILIPAVLLAAFATTTLWANAAASPVKRAGVPADGGQTCGSCHNTYATPGSDPAGDVGGMTLSAPSSYQPGQKYLIQVEVFHPAATRWGFELVSRIQNNETLQAGTFTPNTDVQVKCTDTQAAPCKGAPEFASHNAASTRAGQATGNSWTVEWTAPDADVGAVTFYAATTAANNNAAVTGDRVYSAKARSTADVACKLALKPALIQVITAAADLRLPTDASQRIGAPNSLISLFGSGFFDGTGRIAGAGDLGPSGFPTAMGCVAVEVVGGARLPLSYVGPNQINAQLPSVGSGPVSVRVLVNPDTANQVASGPSTITVLPYAPAFFTLGGTGSIAALNSDNTYLADPSIPGAHAVKPGDIAVLFGTGLGITNPPFGPGAITTGTANVPDPVSVVIGGATLAASDILYVGATPGSISGLYQLNVKVPAGLPDGNAPVVMTVRGISSQPGAFIPVKR